MKLEMQTAELIAIGASITANCQPCLQHHVSKASEMNVDEEEIKEAIQIGKMVRRGAANKMDQFASSLSLSAASTEAVSNQGCGCS